VQTGYQTTAVGAGSTHPIAASLREAKHDELLTPHRVNAAQWRHPLPGRGSPIQSQQRDVATTVRLDRHPPLYLSGRGDGPIRVGVADEREVNAQRAPWCVIRGGVAADRAGHDVGAGRHEVPSDQETGAD